MVGRRGCSQIPSISRSKFFNFIQSRSSRLLVVEEALGRGPRSRISARHVVVIGRAPYQSCLHRPSWDRLQSDRRPRRQIRPHRDRAGYPSSRPRKPPTNVEGDATLYAVRLTRAEIEDGGPTIGKTASATLPTQITTRRQFVNFGERQHQRMACPPGEKRRPPGPKIRPSDVRQDPFDVRKSARSDRLVGRMFTSFSACQRQISDLSANRSRKGKEKFRRLCVSRRTLA